MFFVLLTTIVNASTHLKCVPLNNQKCEIQPTLINSHSNECNQELYYYPFVVQLGKCYGSCNTLNNLCYSVCVQNKVEDLNLCVFNMITWKNESKILTRHISCECKYSLMEENVIQINDDNGKCWFECKKHHACEKDYIWNPATCNCENGNY